MVCWGLIRAKYSAMRFATPKYSVSEADSCVCMCVRVCACVCTCVRVFFWGGGLFTLKHLNGHVVVHSI